MDIVKQLKLQLDDATESDPDVDNVKCIISPIYEDYFNAIDDEQLEDVDMVRFSADPVYSKTQFACLSNDLNYDEKHYENIKQIDEFISDKSIIRLIIACGRGTRANYVWFDGTNEWLYVVEFPNRQLTAVIDRKSIQIRKLEGAL